MKIAYILLVSCIFVAAYESGIDRPYGDLPNMPISLQSNSKPADCQALCDSRKGLTVRFEEVITRIYQIALGGYSAKMEAIVVQIQTV